MTQVTQLLNYGAGIRTNGPDFWGLGPEVAVCPWASPFPPPRSGAAHAQSPAAPGGGGGRPSCFALTPAPAGGHRWGLGAACCRQDPARSTEPEPRRRQLPGERSRFSVSRRRGPRPGLSPRLRPHSAGCGLAAPTGTLRLPPLNGRSV